MKKHGFIVGGVYCPEIRAANGKRTGFKIIDISSREEGILADLKGEGPRIGKYHVNLKDLNRIGVEALKRALTESDYIFIDEIGPMEMHSKKFCRAINVVLDSKKTVLAIIHQKSKNKCISNIRNRNDIIIYEVSAGNREIIQEEIVKQLI